MNPVVDHSVAKGKRDCVTHAVRNVGLLVFPIALSNDKRRKGLKFDAF